MKKEALKVIADSDLDPQAKAFGALGVLMDANPDSIIKSMITIQDSVNTKKAESEAEIVIKPDDYTQTESVLHDMLTENCGVAMMDSGGAYGRHWQQNRIIEDFRRLDSFLVDSWKGSLELTKNVFHALNDILEYDPVMTKAFEEFCKLPENKEESYYYCMEPFAEQYHDSSYPEKVFSENSYNHESFLSQTIQYTVFGFNDKDYVILQIHGGADVRGGYSDPKIFQVDEWTNMVTVCTHANAGCKCIQSYTDDAGYHWYDEGDPFEDKSWNWSDRLKGFYCKECKERVNFT